MVIYYDGDSDDDSDNKLQILFSYSNPITVVNNAKKYLGDDVKVYISEKSNKKYKIFNKNNGKWSHFGQYDPPMEDYTYHKDKERQRKYLARATKIKGSWRDDKFSPNNLSINLLWSD